MGDAADRSRRLLRQSMIDDYWSQFGLPVTGVVGVVRSDIVQTTRRSLPNSHQQGKLLSDREQDPDMRRTWSTYELLLSNCNSFVSEVAAPPASARCWRHSVAYVSELRTLNSH